MLYIFVLVDGRFIGFKMYIKNLAQRACFSTLDFHELSVLWFSTLDFHELSVLWFSTLDFHELSVWFY